MAIPHSLQQTELPSADETDELPFYVPATSSQARPRCALKWDDCFAVIDSHGDIGVTIGEPEGIFFSDTRFLSQFQLWIDDKTPILLGSNLRDDNAALSADLTNDDIFRDGRIVLAKDTLHIVRTFFLSQANAYQRIAIQNHGNISVRIRLCLKFGSDFADLFEVRGLQRPRRGVAHRKIIGHNEVQLTYEGLDRKLRHTSLIFDRDPDRLTESTADYDIELAPKQRTSIFVDIGCNRKSRPPVPFFKALLSSRRNLKVASSRAASVQSSHAVFNEVLCRSVADLYTLITETPEGPYPYAGIPWYSTTFGRDGLITALETLWLDPSIARGVLQRLAAHQARSDDPDADAQPGKILHEMRGGEMAALHEVPFGLYYGSVDATPLFVLLASAYAERSGDYVFLENLWSHIEAAIAWIDGPADPDGDGFVEYDRAAKQGLINQGWKDSHDAIFHHHGEIAEGPIALAEVQGYVYSAKRALARCARRLGRIERADELDTQANALAQRFEAAFWCPEIESYAIALDGAKQPCRVRTSNAGQVLFSGIASAERAKRVAKGLLGPQFFSGWGIRTVAKGEARYNPISYHNGSVWPHDNALIALGFARYGLKHGVTQVFGGLFEAASYMEFRRLPELFCGFGRARGRGPTLYPVACSPQAWASATPFSLLEASLGLEFDPEKSEVRLRNPRLPAFLEHLVLRNLRLGRSSVDIKINQRNEDVSVEVLQRRGPIQVAVIYSG